MANLNGLINFNKTENKKNISSHKSKNKIKKDLFAKMFNSHLETGNSKEIKKTKQMKTAYKKVNIEPVKPKENFKTDDKNLNPIIHFSSETPRIRMDKPLNSRNLQQEKNNFTFKKDNHSKNFILNPENITTEKKQVKFKNDLEFSKEQKLNLKKDSYLFTKSEKIKNQNEDNKLKFEEKNETKRKGEHLPFITKNIKNKKISPDIIPSKQETKQKLNYSYQENKIKTKEIRTDTKEEIKIYLNEAEENQNFKHKTERKVANIEIVSTNPNHKKITNNTTPVNFENQENFSSENKIPKTEISAPLGKSKTKEVYKNTTLKNEKQTVISTQHLNEKNLQNLLVNNFISRSSRKTKLNLKNDMVNKEKTTFIPTEKTEKNSEKIKKNIIFKEKIIKTDLSKILSNQNQKNRPDKNSQIKREQIQQKSPENNYQNLNLHNRAEQFKYEKISNLKTDKDSKQEKEIQVLTVQKNKKIKIKVKNLKNFYTEKFKDFHLKDEKDVSDIKKDKQKIDTELFGFDFSRNFIKNEEQRKPLNIDNTNQPIENLTADTLNNDNYSSNGEENFESYSSEEFGNLKDKLEDTGKPKNSFSLNLKLNDLNIKANLRNHILNLVINSNSNLMVDSALTHEIRTILLENGFKSFNLIIKEKGKKVFEENEEKNSFSEIKYKSFDRREINVRA